MAGIQRPDKPGTQLLGVLTQAALILHEGRMVVSRADWLECDALEQRALVAAGRILDVKQAIRIGLASSGRESEVRAELDGGQSYDEELLSSTVGALRDAMDKRRNAQS